MSEPLPPPETVAPQASSPALDGTLREHAEGLKTDVGGEEEIDQRLATIEMEGEEVAAGWKPAPHQPLSPEVRYLHISRTIHQLITDRIAGLELEDAETANLTGDAGAIVRQRITGTTAGQRAALRALQPRWSRLASAAASWQIDYPHPTQAQDPADGTTGTQRLITGRITHYGTEFETRAAELARRIGVPDVIADPVRAKALVWARAVTPTSTSSEVAITD